MIITTGKLLGLLTGLLILLAFSRVTIRVFSPLTDRWLRKASGVLRLKNATEAFLLRHHFLFGRLAFLSALVHGAYNLWQNGRPSVTGVTVLLFLTVQVLLGNFRTVLPWATRVHRTLPHLMLLALIFHILRK